MAAGTRAAATINVDLVEEDRRASRSTPLTGQGVVTSRFCTGQVGEVGVEHAPRARPRREARDEPHATAAELARPRTLDPWLTANVRPAGSFGRADVVRLRALLDALSACASMVVLDLAAVTLRSDHAADAIDEAGSSLERRGGCLLCINADDDVRARLDGCRHAVVVGSGEPTPLP